MLWAEKKGHIERSPIAHYEKPRPGKRTVVLAPLTFERIQEMNVLEDEFGREENGNSDVTHRPRIPRRIWRRARAAAPRAFARRDRGAGVSASRNREGSRVLAQFTRILLFFTFFWWPRNLSQFCRYICNIIYRCPFPLSRCNP